MITTKKVSEISNNTLFYIPEYQRGYKWTNLQIEQLINDIIQFEKSSNNNLNQTYCLQPIVLKQMPLSDERLKAIENINLNNKSIIFELIDGQQRLTTIFLLLSFLNNRFKPEFANDKFELFYQTRPRSLAFIEKLGSEGLSEKLKKESKKNIDFHHIYEAYEYIYKYFKDEKRRVDINLFESTLLYRTKFIWYEVDESENSSAKEIFKRLNSGKVELTNDELVKALFLGRFNNGTTSSAERMQMSIEWDWIESKLNQDQFWYFLSNSKTEKNNRIRFILDHFVKRFEFNHLNKEDKRYTFLVFNEILQEKSRVKTIWEELKKEFRTIHNWYSDYELFHYIGYLLSEYVREDLNKIFALYNENNGSLNDFKQALLEEIDESTNQIDFDELHYRHHYHLIKKILLWFNISKIIKDKNKNQRFNFYKFKDQKFDLEHIKSLDSEITQSDKSKNDFLRSIFNFYNQKNIDEVEDKLDIVNKEYNNILKLIYDYLKNINHNEFNDLLALIKEEFEIPDEDFETKEDHGIGNLCLLDQGTNRGYKNAIFPIKRQKIIDNDLTGIYILPMTKNAFLKQFSGRTKNLLIWSQQDSLAHKEEIINELHQEL